MPNKGTIKAGVKGPSVPIVFTALKAKSQAIDTIILYDSKQGEEVARTAISPIVPDGGDVSLEWVDDLYAFRWEVEIPPRMSADTLEKVLSGYCMVCNEETPYAPLCPACEQAVNAVRENLFTDWMKEINDPT